MGKPFSLEDRVGKTRRDVRAAISDLDNDRASILEISVTRRKEDLQNYLRDVYDAYAQGWGFVDMVDMMARCHVDMIARALEDPEHYGRTAVKALRDIGALLYPKEHARIRRTLPPGESKESILARLAARLNPGHDEVLSVAQSEP